MRFRTILVAFSLVGVMLYAPIAGAQTLYPRKSIRVVVPFAPGGTADIVGRAIAQEASRISPETGANWQFYVENIAGAGGMVGAQSAARSAPDGYTILLCHIACAVGHLLTGTQGWDPATALIPIVLVAESPNILVAGPGLKIDGLKDFVALAKAKPNTLSLASSGPGSSSHLSGVLLRVKAGIELLDVPYRGSSGAMPDLLSGRVDAMVMGFPEALPFVRDGKLKALGVTSDTRAPSAPEIPTIAEAGVPGYSFTGWLSLFAPAGTPDDIVTALNVWLDKALKSPGLAKTFGEQSIQPGGGPPKIAAGLYRTDIEQWPPLLKAQQKQQKQ